MDDRRSWLRGVALPRRAEIAAERARRVASVDGLPDGWETLEVCGTWMRAEELEDIVAEMRRHKVVETAGAPAAVTALVETVHRRASIRYLMGLRQQFWCGLSVGIPECIGRRERRDHLPYEQRVGRRGCTCLVGAVERAEEAEVDLERAALLARHLARCAHRVARRDRRRAQRKSGAAAVHVRGGTVFSRMAEPSRPRRSAAERFDADPLVVEEEAPPTRPRRSLSPASRRPLSDDEVAELNRRLGVGGVPRSHVDRDGRLWWES